jgi:glycosyltransferase involved in cell wall biosynthesis
MTNRLRILMVCHMPWDRNLGGSRVQVELADEFRSAGHSVEKFSYEDAFPSGRSVLGECLDPRAFARLARAFVRKRSAEYDVIDAQHSNLPYSKRALGFSGLLVARSVGLYSLYAAFAREEARRWPDRPRGSRAGRALRAWRDWHTAPSFPKSFEAADLINVCNQDELAYVRDVLGMGDKCVALPFGMSTARRESFLPEQWSVRERLAAQTVAFIGFWTPRKGSLDWADIVRRVWAARPAARFLFLGTGRSPDVVRADLGVGPDDRIIVVPSYKTDDLPGLLRGATIGAFPSYIEGFPFGVLELVAAGLPTVTYDVPGCRVLAQRIHSGWLVPAGDTAGLAMRLLELLGAGLIEYERLSAACGDTANEFTWPRIALETLAIYGERMRSGTGAARLRNRGQLWTRSATSSSTLLPSRESGA